MAILDGSVVGEERQEDRVAVEVKERELMMFDK